MRMYDQEQEKNFSQNVPPKNEKLRDVFTD